MFKKLKDRLTEEVKIPSQKFTQSMQQLAQAVVSPVSSNNSTHDTASNDNFSIDGDFDDTPQGSPVKKVPEGGVAYRGGQATPLGNSFDAGSGAGFMPVDLQTDTSTPKMPFSDTLGRLRSSSVSSLASDSSFMFPVLESSGPTYSFQSDLESCSEASESVGPNINKEQLVVAYQKIQQKYHKYKGRYADLARHYRDLERDNKNAKHILTECQDKALRRMAELKEQCNLEKQAKAHLEEALRSDLEEKDHLIHTLKTKIKLLRNQADQFQVVGQMDTVEKTSLEVSDASETEASKPSGPEDVDLLTGVESGSTASATTAVLTPEPASNVETENALKEKLKKLESLLHKCKEDITNKRENIKQLESDKQAANSKIDGLQQQLMAIQKREEEASLSLAKNKQTIHLELESKEDEIKKLKAQLAATNKKISELQTEIMLVKEDSKKELAVSKVEAAKLIKGELEELLVQNKNLEDRLARKESESKAHEEKMAEVLKRLEQREAELNQLLKARDDLEEKFQEENRLLMEEVSTLKNRLGAIIEKDTKMEKWKPILKSVQELHGLHKQLKNDVSSTQNDNLLLLQEQNQLIQEKISTIMSDLTQEHSRVLSELDEHKKESVNARESLASVSNEFVLLEQALSSEKSGVESKMSDLEKELKRAEEQIIALQESLASEKSLRKLLEEESMEKLALLGKELSEERSKTKDAHHNSESVEHILKSTIDELKEKLKVLEQDKAKIATDYLNEKEHANSLQCSSEQIQQQLELLTQRNRETINEITSIRMLLDEKYAIIENLEDTISTLEERLITESSEKDKLVKEWNDQEAKLLDNISALQRKYDEASAHIKDIKQKEFTQSENTSEKIITMKRENEKQKKEIVNLESTLQSLDSEVKETTATNATLLKELKTLNTKCQEQTSIISNLQETNEELRQSVEKLQSDGSESVNHIKLLEKNSAELEKAVTEMSEQSENIAKLKEELQTKIEEINALRIQVEETRASCSQLEELLESKTNECIGLTQEVEKLRTSQSDLAERLQRKTEDCEKLTLVIENSEVEKSHINNILEEKVKECENLKTKLSSFEREQSAGTEELSTKKEECMKLTKVITDLEREKNEMSQRWNERSNAVENTASQLESVEQELIHQSKLLQSKAKECDDLTAKLESLADENGKLSQQLKQKISECEDKEAQLDNLADEMKRVEELSQELHRINDDRDANVEVLSTEASSLAQKVEELTITTQQLKEREVNLLAKLQVAQDLEAECISMKQREELLLTKLNEAKAFEIELQANEEDLLVKSKKIEELTEENKKLKEAGQNLTDLINRAKEAEAKCEKLRDDGAGLLLRIQKAEESEIRCSLLEEELDALKKEKAELTQKIETLHAKPVFRESTSGEKSSSDSKEPVVEELCVVKHFTDLTENHQSLDGEKWHEKYNKLLEQHHQTMQENADTIARLKEENILAVSVKNMKQKERLWDRQEPLASLPEGNSNGSLSHVEKLQQQLAAATNQLMESKKLHRQEVDDLRRILLNHGSSNSHSSSRADNLEDATELEYLRNILYEYMMGKEPMILARVIAAVVKFDSEQTNKVLQKEQQRLSLLGHLGIS